MFYFTVITLIVTFTLIVQVYSQTECPNAPLNPQDRRRDKSHLTIATYNAEWLFLNRSNCPGTGCAWPSLADAELHMQQVVTELVIIDADIVNLVEVEDCSVLNKLNYFLNSRDMGYVPYLLKGTDTATGQNVAILTRIDPITNLQRTSARYEYPIPGNNCSYTGPSGTYAVSKHHYVTFNVEGMGRPLDLIGAHLLAFPDSSDRCVYREAQAKVLQSIIAESLRKLHSIVLLGDFNDYDDSVLDRGNNRPISRVLSFLRDPLTDQAGDELINVASFINNQMDIYSNWYDRDGNCDAVSGELSLIDHLLISKDLESMVHSAWVDHSYHPGCHSYDSDHWPIIVKLQTKDSDIDVQVYNNQNILLPCKIFISVLFILLFLIV